MARRSCCVLKKSPTLVVAPPADGPAREDLADLGSDVAIVDETRLFRFQELRRRGTNGGDFLVLRAISNDPGRNGLRKCHILAAQFHVEAPPDSLLVDMPNCRPGGSVPVGAA